MNLTDQLQEQVRVAAERATPLAIRGGGSKAFYGRATQGEPLDMTGHRGVVSYAPSELVITARAGTPLAEIETLLADNGQMLPFEPPHFAPTPSISTATVGGMVAAGLSGPRRPWGGAVRDAVLGVQILNGRGAVLRFGGQVMKNVAGYDLSRLMTGALGTLGVILEVSLKVLPRPARELTLVQPANATASIELLTGWGRRPLPLSASLRVENRLYVRLSGSEQGVAAARAIIGGEEADPTIWTAVRDQTLPFFQSKDPLWRLSLPPATPPIELPGKALVEWGGALRWLPSTLPAEQIRARARAAGGHATLFRGHSGGGDVFQPLPPALMNLHRRVKQALDPQGLFNSSRMYADL